MSKLRVGVIRGGPSSEYEISLKTGENVLRSLSREKYNPVDILITKRGEWHMDGIPTTLANVAEHIDVAWNALHGAYGEDGKLQRELEHFGVPYTGSRVLASALGMHKGLAKERFRAAGLIVPDGEIISTLGDPENIAVAISQKRTFPLIVKPAVGGSSLGTNIVHNIAELTTAIESAAPYGDALVEEVIYGKEATVCVLDGSEKKRVALFPIEIVPPGQHRFFSYEAKYSGETAEICPGRFTLKTHALLRDLALKAHEAIGARHYSRSDFIVSPKGIYVLEINTLPGLTSESLLPKALRTHGIAFSEFLDHVISLAREDT